MRVENTEITFKEVKLILETKHELFLFTKLLGSCKCQIDSDFGVDTVDIFRELKNQIEVQKLNDEYHNLPSYEYKFIYEN